MDLREQAATRGVSVNHHALAVYHWYNADRDAPSVTPPKRCRRPATRPTSRRRLGHALAMQAYLALQANDIDRLACLLAPGGATSRGRTTTRSSPCGRG